MTSNNTPQWAREAATVIAFVAVVVEFSIIGVLKLNDWLSRQWMHLWCTAEDIDTYQELEFRTAHADWLEYALAHESWYPDPDQPDPSDQEYIWIQERVAEYEAALAGYEADITTGDFDGDQRVTEEVVPATDCWTDLNPDTGDFDGDHPVVKPNRAARRKRARNRNGN
jgi:hypothetical protein